MSKVGVTAKSLDDNVDQNSVASAFNASISLSLAPASIASCSISLVAVANDTPDAAKAANLDFDKIGLPAVSRVGDSNLPFKNSLGPNSPPIPIYLEF